MFTEDVSRTSSMWRRRCGRKRWARLILTAATFYLAWSIFHKAKQFKTPQRSGVNHVYEEDTLPLSGSTTKARKTILLWDTFWGEATWEVGLGETPFDRLQCKVRNCRITNDKQELNASDAVLFHIQELEKKPPPKLPHQRWVFFMLESPGWSSNDRYRDMEWRGMFNWTMTYRLDSDVRLHYGSVTRRTARANASKPLLTGRKGLVAWIASNCGVFSKRDDYVRELDRYITVDKYGRCGDLVCPKDWLGHDQNCLDMVNRNYKFYLAFENSLCEDYVTEKFFKILPLDVIPVVRGSADYLKFVPHRWFINTKDYKTPKDLAKYLSFLDRHPQEYRKYFKYKEMYDMKGYFGIKDIPSWCDLCEKLNDPKEPVKYYTDIRNWWGVSDCQVPVDI